MTKSGMPPLFSRFYRHIRGMVNSSKTTVSKEGKTFMSSLIVP